MARPAELAGLRYEPGDLRRGDIDLWQREITVRSEGGKDRIIRIARIGHLAARGQDRYIRAAPGTGRPCGRSCGWAGATGSR
jgi:integrase/recombinase XerD